MARYITHLENATDFFETGADHFKNLEHVDQVDKKPNLPEPLKINFSSMIQEILKDGYKSYMTQGPLIRYSILVELSKSVRDSIGWLNREVDSHRSIIFDNLNINPVDRVKKVTEVYLRDILANKFMGEENIISDSKKSEMVSRLVDIIVEMSSSFDHIQNFTEGNFTTNSNKRAYNNYNSIF